MPQEYPFANKPLGRDKHPSASKPLARGTWRPEGREPIPDGTLIITKTSSGWSTKGSRGYARFDPDAPPSGQGTPSTLTTLLREVEQNKAKFDRELGARRDPENTAEKPRAEKQQSDVASAATGEARAAGIADDIRQLVLGSKVSSSKKSAMLSQLRLWTYFDSEEPQQQRSEPRAMEVLHTGRFKPVRSSDEYDRDPSDEGDSDDDDYDEAAAQAAYDASVNNGR